MIVRQQVPSSGHCVWQCERYKTYTCPNQKFLSSAPVFLPFGPMHFPAERDGQTDRPSMSKPVTPKHATPTPLAYRNHPPIRLFFPPCNANTRSWPRNTPGGATRRRFPVPGTLGAAGSNTRYERRDTFLQSWLNLVPNFFLVLDIIALSFLFNNYYLIID